VAFVGVRVSKMANICIWITASPKPKQCPFRRPVREKLGVWPALPVVSWFGVSESKVDNVIAALERNDRVCQVVLKACILKDRLVVLENKPISRAAAIPGTDTSFADYLSGSKIRSWVDLHRVCCLREVRLPFPEILKLLFDLVDVRLVDIPLLSLISPEPEATVTCPTLNQETIHFTLTGKVDAYPCPSRTTFPALTLFGSEGSAHQRLLRGPLVPDRSTPTRPIVGNLPRLSSTRSVYANADTIIHVT
jgi:hypothetical protein